jgi:hypothetical protein
MLLYFSFFLFGEFLLLNIGKKIGKKIHPNSVKYTEIFQESFVSMVHHSLSSIVLIYIMYYNNWCLNRDLSVSYTETIKCMYNPVEKPLYTLVVMFELGHYIMAIIHTLLFKIVKRVDHVMMLFHHIITLVLIYGGTIFPAGEFGTIYILFTHNLCDIPINIYLIRKNLNIKHKNIDTNLQVKEEVQVKEEIQVKEEVQVTTSLIDNLNAIVLISMWSYLRLYMFGTLTISTLYLFPNESDIILKVAMSFLYVINVVWFFILSQTIYNEIYMRNKSTLYSNDNNIKSE